MDRVSQRHRFPKANPSIFKTWLEVINPQNWPELSDEQIYNRYYVCHPHFTKLDIQEPQSDSMMNKKKIQKGVRKSILTRLQYTRISQLTAKEKIMYSMLKEYNARMSQLKYQNKCLR
ncbi:uncharacterized protein LOC123309524 [Coccinella septempunctata]|uniref:uncharacterized protein LOC123309524 n=1 Tax=Coccinella septempunctata TaxID=41139 RepID=UPI001D09805F|nr:uncharacterized protein LOC123309524 [Coccinella septempunctata]